MGKFWVGLFVRLLYGRGFVGRWDVLWVGGVGWWGCGMDVGVKMWCDGGECFVGGLRCELKFGVFVWWCGWMFLLLGSRCGWVREGMLLVVFEIWFNYWKGVLVKDSYVDWGMVKWRYYLFSYGVLMVLRRMSFSNSSSSSR